jgi:hypothetical protein
MTLLTRYALRKYNPDGELKHVKTYLPQTGGDEALQLDSVSNRSFAMSAKPAVDVPTADNATIVEGDILTSNARHRRSQLACCRRLAAAQPASTFVSDHEDRAKACPCHGDFEQVLLRVELVARDGADQLTWNASVMVQCARQPVGHSLGEPQPTFKTMREALGVEALADTIMAEPASGLATNP